ncbi:phosphotransferase [Aerococcaceae bacterium WGS1372]
MNLVIPKEIRKYIDNQNFQINMLANSSARKMILEDYVLKIVPVSDEVKNEIEMLAWWKSKHLPVPEVIKYIEVDGLSYLLMEKIKGGPSYEIIVRQSTEKLIDILANSLKRLWEVDITECPSSQKIDDKLKKAQNRLNNNLLNGEALQGWTFDKEEFESPEALLEWLDTYRPEENELVLSHGDYSLPNLVTNGRHLAAYIDLEHSGVSDKYQDITMVYQSLMDNLQGKFGLLGNFTKADIDAYIQLFFDKIDLSPDWDKIKYYNLLNTFV